MQKVLQKRILMALCAMAAVLVLIGALPSGTTGDLEITRKDVNGTLGQAVEVVLTGTVSETHQITGAATISINLPVGWYQVHCRPLSASGQGRAATVKIENGAVQSLRCHFPQATKHQEVAEAEDDSALGLIAPAPTGAANMDADIALSTSPRVAHKRTTAAAKARHSRRGRAKLKKRKPRPNGATARQKPS